MHLSCREYTVRIISLTNDVHVTFVALHCHVGQDLWKSKFHYRALCLILDSGLMAIS